MSVKISQDDIGALMQSNSDFLKIEEKRFPETDSKAVMC